MLVYGIRWGFGNFLGFAMGGIQWEGAPSRGFEAQNSDSRTHMRATVATDIPKSGKAWGEQAGESFHLVKAQEPLQDIYDFKGRSRNLPIDSKGLMVDIKI